MQHKQLFKKRVFPNGILHVFTNTISMAILSYVLVCFSNDHDLQ